jgi:hypothetical protein
MKTEITKLALNRETVRRLGTRTGIKAGVPETQGACPTKTEPPTSRARTCQ